MSHQQNSSNDTLAARNWWLPMFLLTAALTVAGSYYWFDYEPPPLTRVNLPQTTTGQTPLNKVVPQNSLGRQSPADAYRTAIAKNPEDHEAYYFLGLFLQTQGKFDEAVVNYRKAISLSGENAKYHNNLGAALAASQQPGEAIEHFNLAVKLDPKYTEAMFNLGNTYMSQAKIEEAMVQYRRAIELKPDYAKAHNNLAVALKKNGHLKEAYQHRYEAMRLELEQQGAD